MESKTSFSLRDVHKFYHGMFGNGNAFLVSILYFRLIKVEINDLYVLYLIHYPNEVKYNEL